MRGALLARETGDLAAAASDDRGSGDIAPEAPRGDEEGRRETRWEGGGGSRATLKDANRRSPTAAIVLRKKH